MPTVSRKTLCDQPNCDETAVMHWAAQWSLFDFGEWYACDAHYHEVGHYVAGLMFSGERIKELTPYWWDLET